MKIVNAINDMWYLITAPYHEHKLYRISRRVEELTLAMAYQSDPRFQVYCKCELEKCKRWADKQLTRIMPKGACGDE